MFFGRFTFPPSAAMCVLDVSRETRRAHRRTPQTPSRQGRRRVGLLLLHRGGFNRVRRRTLAPDEGDAIAGLSFSSSSSTSSSSESVSSEQIRSDLSPSSSPTSSSSDQSHPPRRFLTPSQCRLRRLQQGFPSRLPHRSQTRPRSSSSSYGIRLHPPYLHRRTRTQTHRPFPPARSEAWEPSPWMQMSPSCPLFR